MAARLALRHCTPIKKGTKPISTSVAQSLIKQLSPNWSLSKDTKKLQQEFHFKNFHETIGFVNAVAWIANTEDHHPEMEVGYNRCKIVFTTHAANGLTVNDFICAAKVDAMHSSAVEATAEKTLAIQEVHPPAQKQESAPKNTQLDMQEEELLNIEIKAPEPSLVENDEPEIELSDPDNEPTLPHLQNPGIAKRVTSPMAADEEEVGTDQDGQAAGGGFLGTVIIPPGMQTIEPRNKDRDEEATIIVSSAEEPDLGADKDASSPTDPDEVKTMIMGGSKSHDDEYEEDSDLMKTMIMKTPVFNDSSSEGDKTMMIHPKPAGKNKSK